MEITLGTNEDGSRCVEITNLEHPLYFRDLNLRYANCAAFYEGVPGPTLPFTMGLGDTAYGSCINLVYRLKDLEVGEFGVLAEVETLAAALIAKDLN